MENRTWRQHIIRCLFCPQEYFIISERIHTHFIENYKTFYDDYYIIPVIVVVYHSRRVCVFAREYKVIYLFK